MGHYQTSDRSAVSDLIVALNATGGDAKAAWSYLDARRMMSARGILERAVSRIGGNLRLIHCPTYVVRHAGRGWFEAELVGEPVKATFACEACGYDGGMRSAPFTCTCGGRMTKVDEVTPALRAYVLSEDQGAVAASASTATRQLPASAAQATSQTTQPTKSAESTSTQPRTARTMTNEELAALITSMTDNDVDALLSRMPNHDIERLRLHAGWEMQDRDLNAQQHAVAS